MKILTATKDSVINSIYLMAETNFDFAAKNLVPLIGSLLIQRELQNPRFYDRLARDMANGCIIPPITIAIIDGIEGVEGATIEYFETYVKENLSKFFILDGMQRLNTLSRLVKSGQAFNPKTPIYANILICPSMDHLLYRMITLNNGQKPMTARHQIEVIASNLYDFDSISIQNQTEKRKPGEKRKRGAFKKVDLIKSYLAFLSSSINIDNDKIVQEKMDELIANKIMERQISSSDLEFDSVLNKIEELISEGEVKDWFMAQNNLIGFCAGIKSSFEIISKYSPKEFLESIKSFEAAFASLNVSKLKLGATRRKSSLLFTERFEKYRLMDPNEILDEISMEV